MRRRMSPRAVVRAAGIVLFGFTIGTTQVFAADRATVAEKAVPSGKATPAAKADPADKGSPPASPATDANPTATKDAAIDECGKALDKLAAGDPTALDSFEEQRRKTLMMQQPAAAAVSCLAVAEQNEKFCDLLPKEQKEGCTHQFKMLGSLKGASKDELKARLIFESCSQGGKGNVPVCQIFRDAIASHDAGKCNGLPKVASGDPSPEDIKKGVALCTALATSDASKCKAITDKAEQENCVAYASNDPKRCPKDSDDCRTIVKGFSIVEQKGVAGLGDVDPTFTAVVEGKKACAAKTAELKKGCTVR